MSVRTRERGFSLLEVVVVLAIITILMAIAIPGIRTIRSNEAATSAFSAVRQEFTIARQAAIQQRNTYRITLINGSGTTSARIVTERMQTDGAVDTTPGATRTIDLPRGFLFTVVSGVPVGDITKSPDNQGIASFAMDLDYANGAGGTNTIRFYPDGSARNEAGKYSGGVVYFGLPGDIWTAHALTVLGYTGRIGSWKIASIGGQNLWRPE